MGVSLPYNTSMLYEGRKAFRNGAFVMNVKKPLIKEA